MLLFLVHLGKPIAFKKAKNTQPSNTKDINFWIKLTLLKNILKVLTQMMKLYFIIKVGRL